MLTLNNFNSSPAASALLDLPSDFVTDETRKPLLLAFKALLLSCSHPKHFRHSLEQIYVETRGPVSYLVASDGHTLLAVEVSVPGMHKDGYFGITQASAKAFVSNKGYSPLALSDVGSFPDFRQVIPADFNRGSVGDSIGIAGNLLARLGKICTALKITDSSHAITMRANGPLDAVLFTGAAQLDYSGCPPSVLGFFALRSTRIRSTICNIH